jgi:hypothetical protein
MANYNSIDYQAPYGAGDPYYNASTDFIASSAPRRKPKNKNWLKIVVPLIVLIVIAGAVVGGIFGSRKSKASSGASSGSGSAASSAVSVKNSVGRFATATDSEFMVPLYPSTVSSCFSLLLEKTHPPLSGRPILPYSHHPLSSPQRPLPLPGLQIPFSQAILAHSPFDLIVRVLLPLPTNGQFSLPLLGTILTS